MLKRDFHIHSVHSGHTYATVCELIAPAEQNGMAEIEPLERYYPIEPR